MVESLILLAFWLLAITIAITIHEAAHAYVAVHLGDPTPKLQDRLTLNPIKHYDPIGTTMLVVFSIMRAFGLPVIPFGWAKPVQFDPYNLEDPRRDAALIALAGPVSNFILAALGSVLLRVLEIGPTSLIYAIIVPIITINVVLALFNLIPIHPLDGGKVLVGILPQDFADEADQILRQYGTILLFMLIIPFGGSSFASQLIGPALHFILRLLLP